VLSPGRKGLSPRLELAIRLESLGTLLFVFRVGQEVLLLTKLASNNSRVFSRSFIRGIFAESASWEHS
jgi:hypothetical protein